MPRERKNFAPAAFFVRFYRFFRVLPPFFFFSRVGKPVFPRRTFAAYFPLAFPSIRRLRISRKSTKSLVGRKFSADKAFKAVFYPFGKII